MVWINLIIAIFLMIYVGRYGYIHCAEISLKVFLWWVGGLIGIFVFAPPIIHSIDIVYVPRDNAVNTIIKALLVFFCIVGFNEDNKECSLKWLKGYGIVFIVIFILGNMPSFFESIFS